MRRGGVIPAVTRLGRAVSVAGFIVTLAASAFSAAPQATQPDSPDQSLKQLTLEQLGNIEVTTPSKHPTEIWQTPAAIYVITQDDIRRSGATSIPEALRLAPGVEVARIDGSKWSVGIRGFGSRLSRSVLVLIDGRTVYTTLFAGTYWEVQNVMLEDVDRIEVIRGPGGTIWGPNAVNGVINILTKSAHDTHGLLASAGGGNLEQGFANVRYGGSKGANFDYRLYVMSFNRGPEVHTSGDNFDPWRAGQAGFRTDWTTSTRNSFSLHGDIYLEAAGEQVSAGNYNPAFERVVDGDAHLSGGNLTFQWQRVRGEGNDVQVEAYYDHTTRYEPNLADRRNTADFDYVQHHPLPRQELTWGAGIRESVGFNPEVISGLVFFPFQRTDQLYTFFAQDQITLVPQKLALIAGSKFVVTNYTGLEPEPSVRLLWTPTPTQTFWAAFTRAVRTPSDAEEDFYLSSFLGVGTASNPPNQLDTFARFNANPDFKSEILDGDELGYRQLFGSNMYVDVAAFYDTYKNLLSEELTGPVSVSSTLPFPGPLPASGNYNLIAAQFGNGIRGNTEGMEIAPEWQPLKFWRLRGSYSFLHMNLGKNPSPFVLSTASTIDGSSPQHEVMMQSYLDLPKRFGIDFELRHISALPAQNVPAYTTANLHVSWRVLPDVELSVLGENLFQPSHAEFASDPSGIVNIGRTAYGKVTFTK